jgi:rare lipoprotein A
LQRSIKSYEMKKQFRFITIIPLILIGFCGMAQTAETSNFQKGIASYYADRFEGRKCSSGQIFSQSELTAAHKKLKFGTKVKVTNLKNDSTVVVTINDRLPQNSSRCIDLTTTAARKLNFMKQGLTKVTLEIIDDKIEPIVVKNPIRN